MHHSSEKQTRVPLRASPQHGAQQDGRAPRDPHTLATCGQQPRGDKLRIPTRQALCWALDNPGRKPSPKPHRTGTTPGVRTVLGVGSRTHPLLAELWAPGEGGSPQAGGQGARQQRVWALASTVSPAAAAAPDDRREDSAGLSGEPACWRHRWGGAAALIRASGSRADPRRRQREHRANPR